MNASDPNLGLIIAAFLFSIGLFGVMVRRNLLFMLLSTEVMLNAVALAFISAGNKWHQADGQIMFIMIIAYAAAEASVGLAIVLRLHAAGHATLDADSCNRLKG
ncbi:NADH-quinone oxidoreductase subunit NuoK [Candidatus Kirkpatrickella diaphorinae]|uniref:NADH-quinone oxidoreductase subunit K n=1 Tax=Candidatus Kirkpatrickella diaphorinae TaxID=2984322 RepID=A0ABY6GI83_9PROT|nr:NADH-quinone oxidoreductase subunit NuoK [Candidatus Kirkpatrickella diaphorinae]